CPASLATDTRGLGEPPLKRPPIWSCSGRGLPGRPVTRPPVGSYPTFSPLPDSRSPEIAAAGRLFSVARSFGSPRLGVAQRPALWSPDFPPTLFTSPAVTRPPRPGVSLPRPAGVHSADVGEHLLGAGGQELAVRQLEDAVDDVADQSLRFAVHADRQHAPTALSRAHLHPPCAAGLRRVCLFDRRCDDRLFPLVALDR